MRIFGPKSNIIMDEIYSRPSHHLTYMGCYNVFKFCRIMEADELIRNTDCYLKKLK
jgi:hypothetical protein